MATLKDLQGVTLHWHTEDNSDAALCGQGNQGLWIAHRVGLVTCEDCLEAMPQCSWNAPNGCDELVPEVGDLCREHHKAALALESVA